MTNPMKNLANASIALIDGDAALRRERQLILRGEGSQVSAYPDCQSALHDPAALASDCAVANVDMEAMGGVALLRKMRAKGWHGAGLLLANVVTPAMRMKGIEEGFVLIRPTALDGPGLLRAVEEALHRMTGN